MGEAARPQYSTRIACGDCGAIWRASAALLFVVVVLVAVATGFNLIGPYLVGVAIDRYILVGDLAGLARLALLMVGIAVAYASVTWVHTLFMIRVSQYTVRDMRRDLFGKLQTLRCASSISARTAN